MNQLKKEITLLSGVGQLSTTLMGTGLFMIPAVAAGIAGTYTLWAWIALFIAICPIALTFATLGKHYPNAGGTAYFVRQAFNGRMENAVAWLFVSIIPVGIPPAVKLASGFLQPLLPEVFNSPLFAQTFTVILLMAANLSGSKSSGRIQTVIAISIFALIGAFLWKGDIAWQDTQMPAMQSSQWLPISMALGVMFWCFVGIEAFAHMGEEFKNPQRDFPIAILIGCFVAGATYFACTVVVLKFHAYGGESFDNGSIPWLSEQLFGPRLASVISLVGFLACFASINLYTQSLARMVWAQARQHRPHSPLAALSHRGVPKHATLLVFGVLLASCWLGELANMELPVFLTLANSVFVMIYLLAMLSATRLLRGSGKVLAYIALLLCVLVFVCLSWAMLYALVMLAIFMQPWKKTQTIANAIPTMDESR